MKKWTDRLGTEVSERLGACRNTKEDLPELINARWEWMKENGKDKDGYTKEDAAVCVFELLDSNGQYGLTDLTKEEYDAIISTS